MSAVTRSWRGALLLGLMSIGLPATCSAAPPAPPSDLKASDAPGDVGDRVNLEWTLSADDTDQIPRRVLTYELQRRAAGEEEFRTINELTYGQTSTRDDNTNAGVEYFYRLRAVSPEGDASEFVETTAPVTPDLEYFDQEQVWFGLILLLVCGAVIYFVESARAGKNMHIRRIAGLEAVDEAVGRATEMGRSCLFVPGILDVNDIQTIAGVTVLSRVARLTAEYDARIEVPTCRSLVMTTCRETVESSYLAAGRPDAYREDDIYYLTDEQFGYVAGVTGTMVREKPAACFYMGAFFAESLILAETGNSIGAIQVAGTAMPSQLPFFVAACDYTLIGEEFFAASAYLSGEPHQLGSLKGQDVGKVLGALLIVAGCLLATLEQVTTGPAHEFFRASVAFMRDNMLGSKGFGL